MYVIVEGMPGTGKTTLAKCLAGKLKAGYVKSIFSNTPYGKRFRALAQSGEYKEDDAFYLMDLMLDELRINSILGYGKCNVVRDKCYASSLAHIRAHGLIEKADYADAVKYAYQMLAEYSIEPDFVVYIRSDLENIKKHLAGKDDLSAWDTELTGDFEKHSAQREELEMELLKNYKDKLIFVDCFSGTVEEMCQEIMYKIAEKLNV